MQQFLTLAAAMSDQTRVRALMALRGGELCLCQIIELLGLSPSTVSKHMDLLYSAGLVARRKQGRWQYFRLAGKDAPPNVRQGLAWALRALAAEPILAADVRALCTVRKMDLKEVTVCYRGN